MPVRGSSHRGGVLAEMMSKHPRPGGVVGRMIPRRGAGLACPQAARAAERITLVPAPRLAGVSVLVALPFAGSRGQMAFTCLPHQPHEPPREAACQSDARLKQENLQGLILPGRWSVRNDAVYR